MAPGRGGPVPWDGRCPAPSPNARRTDAPTPPQLLSRNRGGREGKGKGPGAGPGKKGKARKKKAGEASEGPGPHPDPPFNTPATRGLTPAPGTPAGRDKAGKKKKPPSLIMRVKEAEGTYKGGHPAGAKKKKKKRRKGAPRFEEKLEEAREEAATIDGALAEALAPVVDEAKEEIVGTWGATASDIAKEKKIVLPYIQANVRGYLERTNYRRVLFACVRIQSIYKAIKQRRKFRPQLDEYRRVRLARMREEAAVRIQCTWRCRKSRELFKVLRTQKKRNEAALKLQSGFRGMRARFQARQRRQVTCVCLCNGQPHGKMIACDQCYDYFHYGCVGLDLKKKVNLKGRLKGWTCPDCDLRDSKALGGAPTLQISRGAGECEAAASALVRVQAFDGEDLDKIAQMSPNLLKTHGRHLFRQFRQRAACLPTDADRLSDGAAQRLAKLTEVRRALLSRDGHIQQDIADMVAGRRGEAPTTRVNGKFWRFKVVNRFSRLPQVDEKKLFQPLHQSKAEAKLPPLPKLPAAAPKAGAARGGKLGKLKSRGARQKARRGSAPAAEVKPAKPVPAPDPGAVAVKQPAMPPPSKRVSAPL